MPGVWTLNRLARRFPSSNDIFVEAACPTCLQIAQVAFQQQFPTLYAAADQLSLSRLNHRLPRSQTHPEIVQGTTQFHD
jgi:hypothetical protein